MGIRQSKETYNAYMRKYHLKRYYKLRKKAINLLGGKCIICGTRKKLQFDHKNRKNKKFPITRFLSHSKEKILKEIKKCQLLCIKHHNEKSLKEQRLQNIKKFKYAGIA